MSFCWQPCSGLAFTSPAQEGKGGQLLPVGNLGGRAETLPLRNEFPDALVIVSLEKNCSVNHSPKSKLLHTLAFCIACSHRRVGLQNETKIFGK